MNTRTPNLQIPNWRNLIPNLSGLYPYYPWESDLIDRDYYKYRVWLRRFARRYPNISCLAANIAAMKIAGIYD